MANTAQANQPLSSHPLPYFLKTVLGAGSILLPEVELGMDYLVVPPPTDTNLSPVRSNQGGAY